MYDVASFLLVVALVLANMRALRGPTVYDRILAVNMFGSVTILLLAVLGYRIGRPDLLDIAFIYALISFAGVLAVLRFVERGSLGLDERSEQDGPNTPLKAPDAKPEDADPGGRPQSETDPAAGGGKP